MAGNHNFNKPGDAFTGRDEDGRFVEGNPGQKGNFAVEPDEFYRLGMEYCAMCEETKRAPTIAGLCRHLNISMVTYGKYGKREEFAFEWEQVRIRIVEVWEGRLFGSGTQGAQFWLRNNAGYEDKRQTELSGPNGSPINTVNSVEIVGVAPAGMQFDKDAL